MSVQSNPTWALSRKNGLQFKDCLECGATKTLEYHFEVTDGDTIECDECGTTHDIFGL